MWRKPGTHHPHAKSTCTKAMHISSKCEHRKRRKKHGWDWWLLSVFTPQRCRHMLYYTCTWKPLHSPATVPKSASLQCVIITLNDSTQTFSYSLCFFEAALTVFQADGACGIQMCSKAAEIQVRQGWAVRGIKQHHHLRVYSARITFALIIK